MPSALRKHAAHEAASTFHASLMPQEGAAHLDATAAFSQGSALLQAGNPPGALKWIERAHRLAPHDPTIALLLASLLPPQADFRARNLLAGLAAAHPAFRAAQIALAARDLHQNPAATACRLARLLATTNPPSDPSFAALATRAAKLTAAPGWVSLTSDGTLHLALDVSYERRLKLCLDAARLPANTAKLPPTWRQANVLTAVLGGVHLLGSPLDIRTRSAVQGFVELDQTGNLLGWAWLPADPDADPTLHIIGARQTRTIIASDGSHIPGVSDGVLRPRRFHLPAKSIPAGATLRITGPNGTDLAGSPLPLPPRAWRRRTAPYAQPIDVILPVYQGAADFQTCLATLRPLPDTARLVIVDDASPDPALRAELAEAERQGAIILRHPVNRGFPAAANSGLRHAADAGRDALLLNPDTMLPRDLVQRLSATAYSARNIGTVTPMTADGGITAYPMPGQPSATAESPETTRATDAVFQRANAGLRIDLPTAVGFCMFIRHDCLAETGLFREDVFAQGYGEENDFCLRASALGWRHVADAAVFVAHAGGRSFGAVKTALLTRNLAVLNRLHPAYAETIATFSAADPLARARRAVDAARWGAARRAAGAVLLITHAEGGGIARHVAAICTELRAQNRRAILLRPVATPPDTPRVLELSDGSLDTPTPNLRFAPGTEMAALASFLAPDRPTCVQVHSLLGHDPAITGLAAALRLPTDILLHDYALICPRITLTRPPAAYCGEPLEIATCEHCIADSENRLGETLSVAQTRARTAALFATARTITAPTQDTARRFARYFPAAGMDVRPWEDDAALCANVRPPTPRTPSHAEPLRVLIPGAIGLEKGYLVVLACARDAARRDLPLEFVVVGHTMDDARLLATGRVFVTGRYAEEEAVALMRAQGADLGFLPSVWPETWSFALSALWRAGLWAVAFDIGAQAERIQAAGRGSVLNLSASLSRVNKYFLDLMQHGGDQSLIPFAFGAGQCKLAVQHPLNERQWRET